MEKSQKRQGIYFIILAAFCFASMNLFIRLSGDLPTMEKCFFRNLVAAIVAGGMLLRKKEDFHIGKGHFKYFFIRAAAGTAGLICNFYAVDHLNISDASMLNKLSPFFAVIFSIYVLQEKVKAKEWMAVLLAFVGALFVVKPSFSLDSVPALVGVCGGLGAGLAYTFVRKLGQVGEKGSMIVFFFSVFSCIVTGILMLGDMEPMTVKQFFLLLGAGCAATGGQFSITAAYTKAPAKEISVFDYSQVIFAAALGFVFLGQVPDGWSVIGYIIIIGTAVWKAQSAKKDEHTV